MKPLVSILIPYHDAPDTARFLARLMSSIDSQTYTKNELVLMKEGRMGVTYNACIKKAKGDILKFMGSDDYFSNETSLARIVKAFEDPKVYWLATGCVHDQDGNVGNYHAPRWNDQLYKGYNTVGGFATISLRNDKVPLLDEGLDWTVDVHWYWDIFKKHGVPHALDEPLVVIGVGPHQTTEKLTMEQKQREWEYTTKYFENENN